MMTATAPDQEPVAPAEREREAIDRLARLVATDRDEELSLVGSDGMPLPLPATIVRALRQAVAHLARDRAVAVVPIDREFTTQQAADLLNVSRPYLIRLLEEGRIPFTRVGTHRRVRLDDLMAFKRVRDAAGEAALDRLARFNQDLGLYDSDRLARAYPRLDDDEEAAELAEDDVAAGRVTVASRR